MTPMERLDPELVEPLEGLMAATGGGFNLQDIPATRTMLDGLMEAVKAEAPPIDGVVSEDRQVPGPTGAPDVGLRIYRPTEASANLPALLWMHAGGWVLGSIEMDDLMCRQLAKDIGCAIVSVEYRLAPENPFPAPLDDCFAAYQWLSSNAGELGIDRSRIAIGGASAGGGLAAGLALKIRDEAAGKPVLQLLIYPCIDDRNTEQAGDTIPDTLFWSRENALIGWRAYLGKEPGGDGVSPYAAACRATNFSGLPPTFIAIGELDQFLDENLELARRLAAAEVATELHVYPRACHALDVFAPMAKVTQRFASDRDNALKRALRGA